VPLRDEEAVMVVKSKGDLALVQSVVRHTGGALGVTPLGPNESEGEEKKNKQQKEEEEEEIEENFFSLYILFQREKREEKQKEKKKKLIALRHCPAVRPRGITEKQKKNLGLHHLDFDLVHCINKYRESRNNNPTEITWCKLLCKFFF
jgi:hypothetical protein